MWDISLTAALVYLMPGAWSAGCFVFALLFAWAFKAAPLGLLAICCMMLVFFRFTEGQTPDPEWRARLAGLSGKFGTIRDKAASWAFAPKTAQQSAPAAS